jgi:hypothetical protein
VEITSILSAIVGLGGKVLGPRLSRFKRSKRPLAIAASFTYNPYYDASSQTFLAVRREDVDARSHPYEHCGDSGPGGAPFVALSASPFVGVVSVSNQALDGSVPVYVTELVLEVTRVSPEQEATAGRQGVFIGNIMAGGRGSEGRFEVRIATRSKLTLPLFSQCSAHDGQGRLQLRIEPGRYAEIMLRVWFDNPGEYVISPRLGLRSAWRSEMRRVPDTLACIVLSDDTSWPDEATLEHVSGTRERMEPQAFRDLLTARADRSRDYQPPQIPPGRSAVVSGSCASEAY